VSVGFKRMALLPAGGSVVTHERVASHVVEMVAEELATPAPLDGEIGEQLW
jgi:hypothetical protein